MGDAREQTFDGLPRTPEQFGWDFAVECAREEQLEADRLSVPRGVVLAAADEIDRLRAERDAVRSAARAALASIPGLAEACPGLARMTEGGGS